MENDELAVEISEMLEEIFQNYLCYFNVEGCIAHRPEYSNQEKQNCCAYGFESRLFVWVC